MKNKAKYGIYFMTISVITYIILCFSPMFRVENFTAPTEYLIKSIFYHFSIKMVLSVIAGFIGCGLVHCTGQKRYINIKIK